MNLENLTKEEREAIELTREAAGIETPVAQAEEVMVVDETIEERKERLNDEELERLKKLKLSPGATFYYYLINWKDELEKIAIKFPQTSQAMKYNKVTMNPEEAKVELGMLDTINNFVSDGLINNFDVDDYPLSEITEISGFLYRVVNNPKFK